MSAVPSSTESELPAPEPVAKSAEGPADIAHGPITTPVKAEFDWSSPIHVSIPLNFETHSSARRRLALPVRSSSGRKARTTPVKTEVNSSDREAVANAEANLASRIPLATPVKAEVDSSIREAVAAPVKAEVDSSIREAVAAPVKAEVDSSGREAIATPVKAEVDSSGREAVATPVKAEVDSSIRKAVAAPVKTEVDSSSRRPLATPVRVDGPLSPSEKLIQVLSDAKKSVDFIPSPARKSLRMDQKIQSLVHGAEETLNTSRYVLVGDKRNQRSGVQALKNLHQEATNEYEMLYAAYQNLLCQHTKLLADLTSIMQEASTAEELQLKRANAITDEDSMEHLIQTVSAVELEPRRANGKTDKDSVENLVETLSALKINGDKTSEVPTAVHSPPTSPNRLPMTPPTNSSLREATV